MAEGGARPEFGERAEFGPGDVCYRHPSAPSFTLCQRCGRTICGECQQASAVGVLCPECTRQLQPAAGTRLARASARTGRMVQDHGTPVVTYAIMVACAAVFAGQLLNDGVTRALWYAPLYSLPEAFEPWRMVTVMFTHSTGFVFHILFNLYALWLFGRNLERTIGRAAFLVLYLFSGVGGSLGVMLWAYIDPQTMVVPTVGASGAIFGVLAATLVAYRAARVNITSLAVLLALNLAIGFLPGASISWQAHLGGMVLGAVTMAVLLATRSPRQRGGRFVALLGLGVLLAAAAGLFWLASPLALTG